MVCLCGVPLVKIMSSLEISGAHRVLFQCVLHVVCVFLCLRVFVDQINHGAFASGQVCLSVRKVSHLFCRVWRHGCSGTLAGESVQAEFCSIQRKGTQAKLGECHEPLPTRLAKTFEMIDRSN
ncbi:unnamed protein product, partial [Hapterophycus canaliculatus]